MHASRLFGSILIGACLGAGAAAAAQRPEAPAEGTRVIVRALTSAGQPVTDLTAADLTIRTDGKERQVSSLELMSAAAAPAAPAAAPPVVAAAPLPPPFSTNTEAAAAPATGGREFLIILDEEGIGPGLEGPVRRAIAQLAASAAPADRFGLISLRVGGVDIPASPAAVVTGTLEKFAGGGSQNEGIGDMVCRAQRAMQTLTATLRRSSPGRTIVVISPGLVASPAGTRMRTSGANSIAGEAEFSDVCQIRSNDFDALRAAAAASPAAVYVLHYPDGMASAQHVSPAQQGLENITGTVEGEFMRLTGANEATVSRIASETATYYIATLGGGSGVPRRVDVRTTRDGVKVSGRPAGGAGPETAAGTAAKAGTPRDMIRVATVFREMPLRATGLVTQTPGGKDLMLMALFEPEDPATKLTAAAVALFDEKGALKAQWTAQPGELGRRPVTAALPAAPGTYRMRVAVTDAAGRGGTTDTEVQLRLADAGSLRHGSLVMGTDQKSPKLQFAAADPQVIGFLPIFGVTKDMKVSAVYEIRESETGPPLGTTAGNIIEMQGDARMLWGGFGLAPLAPGDYLMRVIVSVDGKEAGTVTRTLRKVQ